MPTQEVKINGKKYTRQRKGQLWTGEDGNIYNITKSGIAVPLTTTVKDYTSGIKGIVNNILPSLLKLSTDRHIPISQRDLLVDLGGTPSKDKRTHAQRNAQRVKDMDSKNPLVRAKYNLLEDSKEGVGTGLSRTVLPSLAGASIPYAFTSIPAFLSTTGGYIGGAIGGTIGGAATKTGVSLISDDDEIIRNSGKVGEVVGGVIGAGKLNPGTWLLKQARGAAANNITPQGYEDKVGYGFQNKNKSEEIRDMIKEMFSPKKILKGTTIPAGLKPLWLQRVEAKGNDISQGTMPYYRNIVWKKVLKQPLTAEENSIYVPLKGKQPSTYDLFWNLYQRERPIESYDDEVVQTYNLEHPALKTTFNRLQNKSNKPGWQNWNDLYDDYTFFGTHNKKDWFTTNGGNIGLKYDVDADKYSMIDSWDIQPFKDQSIQFPYKRQITKALNSKWIPKKAKDAVQNFEVVSQLGGRPIIWKQELER